MSRGKKVATWMLSIVSIVGFTAIWGDFGTLCALALIFWLAI